jgi:hypothetical protein
MPAIVRPSTSVKRPWAVVSEGKLVELHATEAAAQAGADRINRTCSECRTQQGRHSVDCPLAGFERDHDFGSEFDDGDDA